MSNPSIFNEQPNSDTPVQEPTIPTNPFADQLAGIKNEDGKQKYDTIDKALEGLTHAQGYIPQLQSTLNTKEEEIANLRAELDKRQSVEEVVSRITQPKEAPIVAEETTPAAQGFSQEDVAKLVQQELAKNQQMSAAQANVQKVSDNLTTKYGDSVSDVIAQKAKELNTTSASLEQLASQSPDMVLALFNSAPQGSVSPTTGSVNIPSNKPADAPLGRPGSSLLSGATTSEVTDYWGKVRAQTHAKLGVQH